ncbi:MAG: hypothetical protein JWO31_1046 [Phycisphaerales bacterium]|nr:hypothetical protein [Phycisphaerales bacterium]
MPATSPAAAVDRRPTTAPAERTISVEQWMRLDRFMDSNSPRKWSTYRKLSDRGKLKDLLRQQVYERFLTLQRMREEDPRRHDIELRAIKLEDDIYGIFEDAGSAGTSEPATDAALRAKVDELVKNRDEWRVERLNRVLAELQSIGGAKEALEPIRAEIRRWKDLGPEARRARVEKRVEDYKRRLTAPMRPHLARPLPGGRTPPPAGAQPTTDVTTNP